MSHQRQVSNELPELWQDISNRGGSNNHRSRDMGQCLGRYIDFLPRIDKGLKLVNPPPICKLERAELDDSSLFECISLECFQIENDIPIIEATRTLHYSSRWGNLRGLRLWSLKPRGSFISTL